MLNQTNTPELDNSANFADIAKQLLTVIQKTEVYYLTVLFLSHVKNEKKEDRAEAAENAYEYYTALQKLKTACQNHSLQDLSPDDFTDIADDYLNICHLICDDKDLCKEVYDFHSTLISLSKN